MEQPKGPLNTHATLGRAFRDLGIKPGTTLLLHSSLSSLGWVCGGPEAVIQAILGVLGPKGTLVVPTFSSDNSEPSRWEAPPVPQEWWPAIRESTPAYDPAVTRTREMGVIPETLRTWPGTVRSAHPQTSFTAVGPNASVITANHALDCLLGEHSPLARLEEMKAQVLLLGVDFEVCTAFHLAEYRTSSRLEPNSFAVMTEQGREWTTVEDLALSGHDFQTLGASFERKENVERIVIGGAEARLFDLQSAVTYAESWFKAHREGMS